MKKILVLIVSLMLSACASVKRVDIATNKIYPDIKAAALDTRPIVGVKYGNFVNVKIENISPSVLGSKSPNKFEVISLDGVKNQPFTIAVDSICDCLGFRKWAVYPVAYLLDSNGEIVAQETINTPKSKLLKGVFPANGQYKILVVADNTNMGKKIGDAVIYVAGVPEFSLPETVYPTGLIHVTWLK